MTPAPWRGRLRFTFLILALAVTPGTGSQQSRTTDGPLTLHARVREAVVPSGKPGAGPLPPPKRSFAGSPAQTAIIICDMWNQHWCQGATRRVGELAPAMNRTIAAARAKGILIIHAPSSCMDAYKDHPARKQAQDGPQGRESARAHRRVVQQDSGRGEGDLPDRPVRRRLRRRAAVPPGLALEISGRRHRDPHEDAISDSGAEIWNLLESRGITNVMLMGVHTNMCVLGRPFGLRNLARSGKNVVLVRDLTDTMYNSRMWPYVSHFEGTNRIVEHIEKYVAPTITLDRPDRPAAVSVPARRPAPGRLPDRRRRVQDRDDPAGFRRQGARAAGRALHVRDRRPEVAPRLSGASRRSNDADLLVLSVRRRAPKAERDGASSANTSRRASRWSAFARPAMRSIPAARPPRATPNGRRSTPTCSAAITPGIMATTSSRDRRSHPVDKSHPILAGVEHAVRRQGSLYKIEPAGGHGHAPADGKDTGAASRAGRVGQCAGCMRGSSTRRWATPAISIGPVPQAAQERDLLGTRSPACSREPGDPPTASNAIRDTVRRRIAPLLIAARARSHPRGPGLIQGSGRSRSSIWSWPSRSSASRSRSRSTSEGGSGSFSTCNIPFPAGLKMVSHDGVWRAVYDKVPPPPPHHFRGKDKITIHEDTDGDGVFDRHKTFLDGLNIATAVARGRGGVWVLNPPYLLFYPDRDNDDVPDGDPEVHLQGFGLEDTHSVVNSLLWGPDGWLYAAQGSTVTGHVTRPGLERGKEPVHSMGQLIWRYHPETRRYEVFAEGGGNAFGVEIDAKGRIYSGHNGGDTRGFHYVQGGYYQKGFNKHGPLSNPYAFGYFPAMKHNRVPRFTHTFVIYEADALPERYRGLLFGVAPLLNHVVMSRSAARRLLVPDPRRRPGGLDRRPVVSPGRHQARSRRRALHRRLVRPPDQPLPQPRRTDRPGQRADLPAQGTRRRHLVSTSRSISRG